MPLDRIKAMILRRDEGTCWHCGSQDTTIHHRKNRGMGGQRRDISDRLSNLMTMCPEHNSLMESDVVAYREAIENGWKLRGETSSTNTPVKRFDETWWILTDLGAKFPLEQKGLF